MTTHGWDELRAKMAPERRERVDAEVRAEVAKMSNPYKETQDAVEAVLLNSSNHPLGEVKAALFAVTRFAMLECDWSYEELKDLLHDLCEKVVAENTEAE